jgi:hypothetical protein
MAKKKLSEELREKLHNLGEGLGSHARSLEAHLVKQEQFLADRVNTLEKATREQLLLPSAYESELETALEPLLRPSYRKLTTREMQKICKNSGIRGYSRLKRHQLEQLLLENGVQGPVKCVQDLTREELERIVQALMICRHQPSHSEELAI